MMPRLLIAALCALSATACFRTEERVAGGWADTETGHKVAGIIIRADGAPAAGALVSLRPSDYLGRNPASDDSIGVSPTGGTLAELTCDSAGHFRIDSLAPGSYALESRYQEINAVLIRFEMGRAPARMQLGVHRVKPVGSITGRVRFSDGVPGPALVRIRGLERAALADAATGVYTFGNLPEGDHTLHMEGLEPWVTPAEKSGIRFEAGLGANAGEIILQRGLRQGYRIESGAVDIPGVDSTNPVVLENGGFRSPMDGAYLFAKASVGRLDLRGIITSYGKDTGAAALAANLKACARQIAIARQSGMRLALEPVAGALRPLARPRSGNLLDIVPQPGPGAELLFREALKATAARPLVLICGTNLTTAAQVLLAHPEIADRLIVFGANNGNTNSDDTLAAAVVARKARFVAWSREHIWDTTYATAFTPDRIPGRIGDALRGLFNPVSWTPTWAYSYYGDFGPATWLYRRGVWKSAVPVMYAGSPLKAAPTAQPVFDFIDIPFAANDWGAIEAEFYAAVQDPEAYKPWPAPGDIEGEAYSLAVRAAVDTMTGGEALSFKPDGFAEWNVRADTGRTYAIALRYRADSAIVLALSLEGGAVAPDTLRLPASRETLSAEIPFAIPAGAYRLRLDGITGSFALDRFRIR